jgi:hypothetical protein
MSLPLINKINDALIRNYEVHQLEDLQLIQFAGQQVRLDTSLWDFAHYWHIFVQLGKKIGQEAPLSHLDKTTYVEHK